MLQFGHGGEAVEDRETVGAGGGHLGGFNSATAVKPWRTRCWRGCASSWVTRLQFGHGGEAVEDVIAPHCRNRLCNLLQFGHGGEAVEDIGAARAAVAKAKGASIRPRR